MQSQYNYKISLVTVELLKGVVLVLEYTDISVAYNFTDMYCCSPLLWQGFHCYLCAGFPATRTCVRVHDITLELLQKVSQLSFSFQHNSRFSSSLIFTMVS